MRLVFRAFDERDHCFQFVRPKDRQVVLLGAQEVVDFEHSREHRRRYAGGGAEFAQPDLRLDRRVVVEPFDRIGRGVADFAFGWHRSAVSEADDEVGFPAAEQRLFAEFSGAGSL